MVDTNAKTCRFVANGVQAKIFKQLANGRQYAVKEFRERRYFVSETQNLKRVSHAPKCHDYIGCMLGQSSVPGRYQMFMELADADVWNKRTKRTFWDAPLTLEMFKSIATGLLKALVYIHRMNIAHMDIKPENMLISNNKVKLIDFGYSCKGSQCDGIMSGTRNYMPPESIEYDGRGGFTPMQHLAVRPGGHAQSFFEQRGSIITFLKKHDVFGLAVSLHELLHNRYCQQLRVTVVNLVRDKIFVLPRAKHGWAALADESRPASFNIPANYRRSDRFASVYRILDKMMHPNPTRRITAAQALSLMERL